MQSGPGEKGGVERELQQPFRHQGMGISPPSELTVTLEGVGWGTRCSNQGEKGCKKHTWGELPSGELQKKQTLQTAK